jgi:hypothetical protein
VNTTSIKLAIVIVSAFVLPVPSTSLLMAAGPGVHGRVLGHDEQGKLLGIVSGAKIEFQDGAKATVASTVSDQNGYYKADLPPGEYYYQIQAAGYRTEDAGRGLRLSNSQGYAIFNLAMTQGMDDPDRKPPIVPAVAEGKLRGSVLEMSPAGKTGVPAASITLREPGSSQLRTVYSRSTADQNKQVGDYEISLPVGTYDAVVTAKGFETFKDSISIVIEDGKEAQRDFILSRPHPPTESTGQGVRGVVKIADESRLQTRPQVQLQVLPLNGGPGLVVEVSADGEFTQDLEPGIYRLVASAEGYPEAASRPVYVFSGSYSNVNLILQAERVPHPETALEVLVVQSSSATGKNQPLPGATVSILKAGAEAGTASEAETDATGHAVFFPQEAGKYTIDAHATGFQGKTSQVEIIVGQTKSVTLELTPMDAPSNQFTLDVTVTDARTKLPLSGVKLMARHADDALARSNRTVTDFAGKAKLIVAHTGSYTLLAQAVGYSPAGTKINVLAEQLNYSVNLAMEPTAPEVTPEPQQPDDQRPPTGVAPTAPLQVTGFVAYRDEQGQLRGVQGAKLVWERIVPSQPPMTMFTTSGENGKYDIKVQKGLHQVRVEPPAGFGILTEQVQISMDGQSKYFVVVRSNIKPPDSVEKLVDVSGVVVTQTPNGSDIAVKGAEILFSRAAGVAHAQADDRGKFTIRLPVDSYRAIVNANGFEQMTTPVRVIANMQPLRLVLKRLVIQNPDFRFNLTVVQNAGRLGFGPARTIPGAEVSITDAQKQVIRGVADRTGQYSVRLKPGTYTVRATKTGFRPESLQLTMPARDLSQQIALTSIDVTPPETQFTLTVRVLEHQEPPTLAKAPPVPHPINGASLSVIKGSQVVASGTTNNQGQYVVKLPKGDYAVKASATGFAPAGQTVSITNQNASLTFSLTKRTRVEIDPSRGLRRGTAPIGSNKTR